MEPTYAITRSILVPWMRTWFRWNVEGADNIPRQGPALFAFNHIAFLDPLVAAYAIDGGGRHPRFLAKHDLWSDKRVAWLVKGTRQIPVTRGTASAADALRPAIDALRGGEAIVIFPEGTITTDPTLNTMRAKSGVARLALGADVPIIPCALWGTANVWGRGTKANWRPRQDICVRIGEPMAVEGDPGSREDWTRIGDEVMRRVGVLLASIRTAVPDRRRPQRKAAA